jgi:hypothetical protein
MISVNNSESDWGMRTTPAHKIFHKVIKETRKIIRRNAINRVYNNEVVKTFPGSRRAFLDKLYFRRKIFRVPYLILLKGGLFNDYIID